MTAFFMRCGLFAWPIVGISLFNLSLIARLALRMRRGRVEEREFNGLLFWGGLALLCGVIGQCLGLYNAMLAVAHASALSPQVILAGVGESFSSTLFGLQVLLLSSLAWLVLRRLNRRNGLGLSVEGAAV